MLITVDCLFCYVGFVLFWCSLLVVSWLGLLFRYCVCFEGCLGLCFVVMIP